MGPDPPIDWSAYVDALSELHDLQLDGARRAEVARQLERIDALARRLTDFPLEPEIEPAPVFRP